MPARTIALWAAWFLSLALLLITAVGGIYNGLNEWSQGHTAMQHSVTGGEILYGISGLVSAYGLFRRRRWSLRSVVVWSVAVTYVPGVAIMVYGDEGGKLGSAIAASGATELIALGVLWTTNVVTRKNQLTVANT